MLLTLLFMTSLLLSHFISERADAEASSQPFSKLSEKFNRSKKVLDMIPFKSKSNRVIRMFRMRLMEKAMISQKKKEMRLLMKKRFLKTLFSLVRGN